MQEQEAPVSVGQEHDVFINAVGEKGDGIAKVKGFVVFVPNVRKGDYVRIKITKVLPKVGFGEVVQQLEKPERPQKYATVSKEDLSVAEPEPETHYEDSEDFGDDEE